ncbi:MAG: SPOR domain-containing protein [Gammaproteobacteria bacterium]
MKDSKLKQRLIGAFVLIILVVIFVPMLLDEPRESSLKVTNIPAQPQTEFSSKVTPLDEPIPLPRATVAAGADSPVIVDRDAAPAAESAGVASPKAGTTPVPATAELAMPDQPPEADAPAAQEPKAIKSATADRLAVSSWVVQLASFTNEQNALKLRDQLRAKGYTTFVESVDAKGTKGTKVFRVRVGPELDRLRAEAIREKLEKELKLKGIVGPYVS